MVTHHEQSGIAGRSEDSPADKAIDVPDPVEAVDRVRGAIDRLADASSPPMTAAERLRASMKRLGEFASHKEFGNSLRRHAAPPVAPRPASEIGAPDLGASPEPGPDPDASPSATGPVEQMVEPSAPVAEESEVTADPMPGIESEVAVVSDSAGDAPDPTVEPLPPVSKESEVEADPMPRIDSEAAADDETEVEPAAEPEPEVAVAVAIDVEVTDAVATPEPNAVVDAERDVDAESEVEDESLNDAEAMAAAIEELTADQGAAVAGDPNPAPELAPTTGTVEATDAAETPDELEEMAAAIDAVLSGGSEPEPAAAAPDETSAKIVAAESIAAEPVIDESITAEPITAEPVPAESITAESITAEPVTTEPITAEPITAETITTESTITEPATAEPAVSEPVTVEQDRVESAEVAPDGSSAAAPAVDKEPGTRSPRVQPLGTGVSALDRALANDIDTLLDGDLDAVTAVLDEVFDESAIVVQDLEDDVALMPDICCDDGGTARPDPIDASLDAAATEMDQADGDHADASFEALESEPAELDPENAVTEVAESPPAPEPTVVETIDTTSADGPVTEVLTTVSAATEVVPRDTDSVDSTVELDAPIESDEIPEVTVVIVDEPAVDDEDHASIEIEVAVDSNDLLEATEAEVVAPEPASSRAAIMANLLQRAVGRAGNLAAPLWDAFGPLLLRALQGANYPLRFVPHTVRPVVDWLALSLLFWVPIVWFIALVLVG